MTRPKVEKVKGHPGIYRRRTQGGKTVYDVRYRIPNAEGKKVMKSATFSAVADADAFRADKVNAVRNHGLTLPPRLTFSEFMEKHCDTYRSNLSPSTLETLNSRLKNHFLPAFGRLQLSEITPERINSFLKSKLQLESKTRLNIYTDLHRLLKLAVDLDFLRLNPCDRVMKPKAQRKEKPFLTPVQIRDVFDALAPNGGRDYRPFFVAFVITGLRLSEILGLKWQDYDSANRLLYVRRAVVRRQEKSTPKTRGAVKAVRVSPTLASALDYERRNSLNTQTSDYIFSTINGKPLSGDDIRRRILYPALQQIGIPMVETKVGKKKVLRPAQKSAYGFHLLRHSMGSNLTMRTGNLKIAQLQLGHASITTTSDIYAHLERPLIDAEIDALDAEVFDSRGEVFDRMFDLNPSRGVVEMQVV